MVIRYSFDPPNSSQKHLASSCSPARMDGPASAHNHIYRPHAQQDRHDHRYTPIPPPPPFSARPSSAQSNVLHSGDPFLQRRVETTDPHGTATHSRPYGISNHASYISETFPSRHEQKIREEYGSLIRDRSEGIGQYAPQVPNGMYCFLCTPVALFTTFSMCLTGWSFYSSHNISVPIKACCAKHWLLGVPVGGRSILGTSGPCDRFKNSRIWIISL